MGSTTLQEETSSEQLFGTATPYTHAMSIGSLPEQAWVVLVSDSPDDRDGGEFVPPWHETERKAAEARDNLQGSGAPYYRVEQITRAKLEVFLSNPPSS
jgi:hypothetical protein